MLFVIARDYLVGRGMTDTRARSGVENKEFVFCARECRWTIQFVWRRRRYGPESVSLKIKNENGVHMGA